MFYAIRIGFFWLCESADCSLYGNPDKSNAVRFTSQALAESFLSEARGRVPADGGRAWLALCDARVEAI